MQVTGAYRLSSTPEQVWAALFDPAVLRQCIPGCEDLQRISPTEFTAAVVLKVGPVKAKFSGKVTLSNLDKPRACRMTGEGSGGAAGFAKGVAELRIAPDGQETILNYTADAQIGGKLAQLGSRMVESTTKKLADEFFSRFAEEVSGDRAGGRAAASEGVSPVKQPTASGAGSAWSRAVWVALVGLAAGAGYLIFLR